MLTFPWNLTKGFIPMAHSLTPHNCSLTLQCKNIDRMILMSLECVPNNLYLTLSKNFVSKDDGTLNVRLSQTKNLVYYSLVLSYSFLSFHPKVKFPMNCTQSLVEYKKELLLLLLLLLYLFYFIWLNSKVHLTICKNISLKRDGTWHVRFSKIKNLSYSSSPTLFVFLSFHAKVIFPINFETYIYLYKRG